MSGRLLYDVLALGEKITKLGKRDTVPGPVLSRNEPE